MKGDKVVEVFKILCYFGLFLLVFWNEYFYLTQNRVFQIPVIRCYSLWINLKGVYHFRQLKLISQALWIDTRIWRKYRICRAYNAFVWWITTCSLPHSHRVVSNVPNTYFLVFWLIIIWIIVPTKFRKFLDTIVDSNRNQFAIRHTFNSFCKAIAQLTLFPSNIIKICIFNNFQN